MDRKEGTGAVYGRGLKLVCLGLVIRKRWFINCCSRPVGDENEHDDENLINPVNPVKRKKFKIESIQHSVSLWEKIVQLICYRNYE